MAKVHLDFEPPGEEDIAALRIYESASEAGPFVEIERVADVGAYPNYITRYTSNLATSSIDWFTIAWEDSAGYVGEMSAAWKGGTTSLVQKIIDRVRDHNTQLNERVVQQEAEAVIEEIFGIDPYDPDAVATITYRQLSGLTYLVLARSIITSAVIATSGSSLVSSATLGLVSFKNESGSATAILKAQSDTQSLLDLANHYLGISTSFVMQLEEITCNLGLSSYDHSRLIGYVGLE